MVPSCLVGKVVNVVVFVVVSVVVVVVIVDDVDNVVAGIVVAFIAVVTSGVLSDFRSLLAINKSLTRLPLSSTPSPSLVC